MYVSLMRFIDEMLPYTIRIPHKEETMATIAQQLELFSLDNFPNIVREYPMIRYMGSKFRLLPWIHGVLSEIQFDSALDGFSGSGCVGYLLKAMGKQVHSVDFLNFPTVIATAMIENPGVILDECDIELLLTYDSQHRRFIENKFDGIFFTTDDLRFLDQMP